MACYFARTSKKKRKMLWALESNFLVEHRVLIAHDSKATQKDRLYRTPPTPRALREMRIGLWSASFDVRERGKAAENQRQRGSEMGKSRRECARDEAGIMDNEREATKSPSFSFMPEVSFFSLSCTVCRDRLCSTQRRTLFSLCILRFC